MYLDFHTHGKLAKKLPFSTAYTDWLFGEAKEAGLDALCLTEHFNTLQFDELYGYLMKTCDREGDTLVTRGRTSDFCRDGDRYPRGRPYPLSGNAGGDPGTEPETGAIQRYAGDSCPFRKLMDLFRGISGNRRRRTSLPGGRPYSGAPQRAASSSLIFWI